MPLTPRHKLRSPLLTDQADVPLRVQHLADDVDAAMLGFSSGPEASRPSAALDGRIWRSTDTGRIWLDTGSNWVQLITPSDDLPGRIDWGATPHTPPGWTQADGKPCTAAWPVLRSLLVAWGRPHDPPGFSGPDPLLPDLRGRMSVGYGAGPGLTARHMGATPGVEAVLLTARQSGLRAHLHPIVDPPLRMVATGGWTWTLKGSASFPGDPFPLGGYPSAGVDTNVTATKAVAAENALDAHDNMPPSVVLFPLVRVF